MNSNINIEEDSVDIKNIFSSIMNHKWLILLIVLISTLISGYIAYFTQDIYRASVTVEVGLAQRSGYFSRDILSRATSSSAVTPDTEIEIIKSRFLAKKAQQKVDKRHHYYAYIKYKNIELYKNSPFVVGMNSGYGIHFELYPMDKKHYRLVVKDLIQDGDKKVDYDKVLEYDKEVVTPYFHINILAVDKFKESKYSFVIDNPSVVNVGAVSAKPTSKYSAIIRINYEDNVALRAKEYVNALASSYIEQNIEKKSKEARKKLEFIDRQLKYITQNLRSSAIKIEDFKKRSNTVSLNAKANNIIKQISNKEARLSDLSINEEILNNLLNSVKKGRDLESLVVVGLKHGNSLSDMIKTLQDTILQKKMLREDYTELYPDVRKLTRTIKQLKKIIISTIKNMKKGIAQQRVLLQNEIDKQQEILDRLPADERMYAQLQRKFAVNEKIYSYLLEKRSETEIIKASTVSKNRIIDEALTPSKPIKPKRIFIVSIGFIAGLFLGIVLASILNYMNNTIKREEDVSNQTDIPILGTIPHLKSNYKKLAVLDYPRSSVAEAFRNIRTNLQFMLKGNDSKVILLTSTIGGEGKSTIVSNLGAILSITNKKVIILNLDMRKPTLHNYFELSNDVGMSSLLSNHSTLQDVIQKSKYSNIDIITSGPIPPNPSELLEGVILQKVLEKLKDIYDVIILDTPPVGLVTDARVVMPYVDANIYIIRADYSKKEFVKVANSLSKNSDISSVSIVINDIKNDKGGYGYYEE